MTPTLKEQLEQWIDREAITRETYEEELSFREGAHSILPMLLVALEGLELVKHESIYVGENGWKDEYFLSIKSATEALNKIKSMIEGNENGNLQKVQQNTEC